MGKTEDLLYFIHREIDKLKESIDGIVKDVKGVVAAPVISCTSNTVTMSTTTTGATIYYTTDGSQPDAGSTAYSAGISISADTTFKAVAIKDAWKSDVTEYDAVYVGA